MDTERGLHMVVSELTPDGWREWVDAGLAQFERRLADEAVLDVLDALREAEDGR